MQTKNKLNVNWDLVEKVMLQEVDDNFCTKCKICGVVIGSGVVEHLQAHKN